MARHPALDDRGLPRLAGKWTGAARRASSGRPKAISRIRTCCRNGSTEECDAEPGNIYKSEATAKLFASWTEFANKAGEKPGSIKAFSAELTKRGFERGTEGHAKTRCFKGVRLFSSIPRGGDD